jgi:hypothetical protein
MRSLFCPTQAIFLLLLFLAVVPSRAADGTRDGNWWREVPQAAKSGHLVGFFDGMDLGKEFLVLGIETTATGGVAGKGLDPAARSAFHKSYMAVWEKYMNRVTNGQISDGLDKFYDDYRNRRISTSNAVYIVLNFIGGRSEREMTTMIESFRKNSP